MVPWLVLFATAVFAWGSFVPQADGGRAAALSPLAAGAVQFCIAHLRRLFRRRHRLSDAGGADAAAGLPVRAASATKNVLAGVMNASAVADLPVLAARSIGSQAARRLRRRLVGGFLGAHMLRRVNEKALRVVVVIIGLALTVGCLCARGVKEPAAASGRLDDRASDALDYGRRRGRRPRALSTPLPKIDRLERQARADGKGRVAVLDKPIGEAARDLAVHHARVQIQTLQNTPIQITGPDVFIARTGGGVGRPGASSPGSRDSDWGRSRRRPWWRCRLYCIWSPHW